MTLAPASAMRRAAPSGSCEVISIGVSQNKRRPAHRLLHDGRIAVLAGDNLRPAAGKGFHFLRMSGDDGDIGLAVKKQVGEFIADLAVGVVTAIFIGFSFPL